MRALIIGSGDFAENATELLEGEFFTICADGGYTHAKKIGIVPDILIGDMDSIKDKSEVKSIVFPCEKDETDSELAIDYAISKGFSDLVLLGLTGTRLDHTLNNIFLLKRIAEKGAKAVIIDSHNEIYYLDGELRLSGDSGEFFSIIPVSSELTGVTVKNAKYPLDNETLYFGKSRGISNQFLGTECVITVKSGTGIVIKARD